MELDQAGMNLLLLNEGFRSHPYLDANNVPTIGIGTCILPNGVHVTMNTPPITKTMGIAFVEDYLNKIYAWLNDNCKWHPSQDQWNALCSFLYNLGLGSHLDACPHTKQAIIDGNINGIINGMLSVNNDGLLTSRREREVAMFRGEYDANTV